MSEGPIGGEFVSLVHLTIGCQEQLAALNKKDPLLKYAIEGGEGEVVYNPAFSRRFSGNPLNTALQSYHTQLEMRICELRAQMVI